MLLIDGSTIQRQHMARYFSFNIYLKMAALSKVLVTFYPIILCYYNYYVET